MVYNANKPYQYVYIKGPMQFEPITVFARNRSEADELAKTALANKLDIPKDRIRSLYYLNEVT